MFAIIRMILAALLAALSSVATAKRSDVEDPPAKKKTDDDTDPIELELERSMERSSPLEHERDRDNDSNYLKKDERTKSSLTQEDILNFQRLLHPDMDLREQEAEPKKKTFREVLNESLKDIKPIQREAGKERGLER